MLTGIIAAIARIISVLLFAVPEAASSAPNPVPPAPTPSAPNPVPPAPTPIANRCVENPISASMVDLSIGVAVEDLVTGCSYQLGGNDGFSMASTAKAEILGAVLLKLQDAGETELDESTAGALTRMVDESDNAAADALLEWLGGPEQLQQYGSRLGLVETDNLRGEGWGFGVTTPNDQIRLLHSIAVGDGPLSSAWVQYARDLLASIVPEQAWGVSVGPSDGSVVLLKNGWYDYGGPDGNLRWRVNSIGMIEPVSGHSYLIAVDSDGWSSMEVGVAAIEELSARVAAAFGA